MLPIEKLAIDRLPIERLLIERLPMEKLTIQSRARSDFLRGSPLWDCPEALYVKSTSKDRTVSLARLLKAKSDLPRI